MKQFELVGSDSVFDAVILDNGDYPTHPVPLSILRNATYLCCCDGAAEHQLTFSERQPDAIVGDGDSLSDEIKRAHTDILHTVSEQNDNDQTKTTRFCMSNGARSIAYIGATGKREDHTLGNISLLSRYMEEFGLDVTMVTDHGWFVPAKGERQFVSFKGQQVSIFNIDSTQLDSTGLKWNSYAYKHLWQGTLNEAVGDSFTIKANGSYLTFRTFEAKKHRNQNI